MRFLTSGTHGLWGWTFQKSEKKLCIVSGFLALLKEFMNKYSILLHKSRRKFNYLSTANDFLQIHVVNAVKKCKFTIVNR